jgi:hypothetical protein
MRSNVIEGRAALWGLGLLASLLLFYLLYSVARADDINPLAVEFSLPSGHHAVFGAPATGVQIYRCEAVNGSYAWQLRGIDARLLDSDGRLFARQTGVAEWVADDGSSINGQLAKSIDPAQGSGLPDQLYAIDRTTAGVFLSVTDIVRDHVSGGLPPAQACDAAAAATTVRVPFKADYVFFEAGS